MELKTTDLLAIERTKLANERTFLAYFRTFVVIFSSGVATLKLDILSDIKFLAYFLLAIAPILLIIGIIRFFLVKKRISGYYN